VLGVGLSGLPFTGPDIGGFSGNPSAELYLRWFQLAAFLPFFRTHSAIGTDPREPWIFGEPYTHILGEFLRLRYRLLPYLYTLAWQASQTGAPLARPLFWIDPADQRLWAVDDAFLLGDALLIAPVLEEGQTRRKVQLPHGRWYSLWDKAAYQGPGAAEMQAPLERIPVLVHGSNILPLADNDHLTLHIYPPEGDRDAPAGSLYSDAGDGYGPWRLDRFIMQRIEKTLEITWSSEGDYPFPYPQVNIQLHGLQAQHAWINDQPIPVKENHIESGAFSKLRIEA
jgi:alpha-glucosidase